jgi:hypothetical protein
MPNKHLTGQLDTEPVHSHDINVYACVQVFKGQKMAHMRRNIFILACFPYFENIEWAYEIALLSVCVCVPPLSLLGNGSIKVPLSLLGNGSVKSPYRC